MVKCHLQEVTSKNANLHSDLTEMQKKLNTYVEKGRIAESTAVNEESIVAVKPDPLKIRPLRKINKFDGTFLAVDCSTRTLKRANNWGIYLMRVSYAHIQERAVKWSYLERVYTAVGDSHVRRNLLTNVRIELESQMALSLLENHDIFVYDEHTNARRNYLLLDGAGYFGGERKYGVSLYDECEKREISLLAISKNSPVLHDEKGRDFVATTSMIAPYTLWVYPTLRKANRDEHLYGDISVIKLCETSERVFRCDIMEYLTGGKVEEILSPLTCLSEDPRCLGYPIPLYLAHEFSSPADSMLMHYHDRVEEQLGEAGLLKVLRQEEQTCSFADELHGVKHVFQWEWWDGQF